MGSILSNHIRNNIKNDFKLRQNVHSFKYFFDANVPVVQIKYMSLENLQTAILPHLTTEHIQLLYDSMHDTTRDLYNAILLFDGGSMTMSVPVAGKGLLLIKTRVVEDIDMDYVIAFSVGDIWLNTESNVQLN
jgi:hypothetical protein